MTKRVSKGPDGKYHIKGRKYELLIGSRAQVHHGTAYKTPGGLTKEKILMNKHGRIVSRKKHTTAKKEKRLEKAGYFAKKGKFGAVRRDVTRSKRLPRSVTWNMTKKSRSRRRSRRH